MWVAVSKDFHNNRITKSFKLINYSKTYFHIFKEISKKKNNLDVGKKNQ